MLVLLDEVIFEQKRFYLAIGNGKSDITDSLNHVLDAIAVLACGSEIAAYPFFEVFGFAYIDDFPFLIEKAIYAGIVRQIFDDG